MKMSILWSSPATYSLEFFKELHSSHGFQLQIIHQAGQANAPYKSLDFSFFHEAIEDSPDIRKGLYQMVEAFSPDCILMASWPFRHFMQVSRRMRTRGVYVVAAMDNQWHGTLKQHLGVISSPLFLKPSIDTLFVAGDRQRDFARRLGYDDPLHGYYSGEIARFRCPDAIDSRDKSFLFIGRLVPEKGINELAAAYKDYRQRTPAPWKLKVAGTGPLAYLLQDIEGVELVGFVQPDMLPSLTAQARCFVLPSLWEPWGVVVHEAAAAGLPIIATTPCGSTTMFLRDGVNGFVVPPRPEAITEAMLRISELSADRLRDASEKSRELAELWSPSLLARYFAESVGRRIQARRSKRSNI